VFTMPAAEQCFPGKTAPTTMTASRYPEFPMALAVGARLGPYEILSAIGAGGMGEVYRARDTKLKRDVALKVLPEAFASNVDRMARFQREAEVLASLNHPNIAHLYGVEECAIVMELVEGESPKGPMPFEDAWKVAMQIADALEYAHEKGVMHRDLKPANVKITPDGPSGNIVKLLDFGLARVFSPESGDAEGVASITNSPTLTVGGTLEGGVILGTAAYMAPEQAKGKRLDKRADIWSWGVVLYELITGERLFRGEDVAETLAQVLTREPDLERVPPKVRRLLGECLQKDPKLRLRDIGDAKRLLEEPAPDRQPALLRSRFGWPLLAAVLVVIAAALGLVTWKHVREESAPLAKLFFPLPRETYDPGRPPSTAVSPDGRRVAIFGVVDGKGELRVRDLDKPAPQILVADGASAMPFWAPDSRRLAFFSDGKLKKIDVTGGPAVTIADAQGTTGGIGPWSGSWNKDDVIVFGRITSPLFRVAAAGGSPAKLTELDGTRHETAHFAPWFLPDGHHFLYIALSTDSEKRGVFVADLASGSRKQLPIESTRTIYVAPGYLLFARDGTLMAQRFDTSALENTADAVPLAEQADSRYAGAGVTMGYFSASQNGVLVYTSGRAPTGVQLTWFDRTGKRLETAGAPAELGAFSLSPDETRVAFMRRDAQAGHDFLWTRDLARGAESRLTTSRIPPIGGGPVWSADGTHIFYGAGDKIVRKAANNTGAEEVVEVATKQPMDASRDGRFLFTVTPRTNDIWVLSLFGDRQPIPYVQTAFQETQPRLSPDGRWLAYQSNESKRNEIYVVSFPQPGEKWQISTDGGQAPVWSHDGREVYYYSGDSKIMAVDIKPGTRFQFGAPKALFEARVRSNNVNIDVSKDGRFLLPALVDPEASTPMTVVLNWPALLPRGR
jgi:eukaryotic-like serine/threonine-protein kinase